MCGIWGLFGKYDHYQKIYDLFNVIYGTTVQVTFDDEPVGIIVVEFTSTVTFMVLSNVFAQNVGFDCVKLYSGALHIPNALFPIDVIELDIVTEVK